MNYLIGNKFSHFPSDYTHMCEMRSMTIVFNSGLLQDEYNKAFSATKVVKHYFLFEFSHLLSFLRQKSYLLVIYYLCSERKVTYSFLGTKH